MRKNRKIFIASLYLYRHKNIIASETENERNVVLRQRCFVALKGMWHYINRHYIANPLYRGIAHPAHNRIISTLSDWQNWFYSIKICHRRHQTKPGWTTSLSTKSFRIQTTIWRDKTFVSILSLIQTTRNNSKKPGYLRCDWSSACSFFRCRRKSRCRAACSIIQDGHLDGLTTKIDDYKNWIKFGFV